MSIGLVHDYLLVMRGAERSFAAMAEAWPDAPIYTTVYSEQGTEGRFAHRQVVTSPLQHLRPRQGNFRRLLPLYPWAVASLPVSGHTTVVSSSSAFAHGARVAPWATHVCYCYTPFRYAWHERELALREVPRPLRPSFRIYLEGMRRWDRKASRGVTRYVAISKVSQERIAAAYGREANIVHPPVDVDRFASAEPEDFFLTVGELVAHKRLEVALQAVQRVGARVKVVGTGPELARLRGRYGDVTEFLGRVTDAELDSLYARARAYLLPNVEEFGIVAVESQAAGRPVVATGKGGATETIVDGETGILLVGGTVDEFAEALRAVDFSRFDSERIREHAQGFSTARFQAELTAEVERATREGIA